jgi:hypothetical protein
MMERLHDLTISGMRSNPRGDAVHDLAAAGPHMAALRTNIPVMNGESAGWRHV